MLISGAFPLFHLYNCYVTGGEKNPNTPERLFRDTLTSRDILSTAHITVTLEHVVSNSFYAFINVVF